MCASGQGKESVRNGCGSYGTATVWYFASSGSDGASRFGPHAYSIISEKGESLWSLTDMLLVTSLYSNTSQVKVECVTVCGASFALAPNADRLWEAAPPVKVRGLHHHTLRANNMRFLRPAEVSHIALWSFSFVSFVSVKLLSSSCRQIFHHVLLCTSPFS